MNRFIAEALCLSLLFGAAASSPFAGPIATPQFSEFDPKGISPMPTAEPVFAGLDLNNVGKRQNPANTCGPMHTGGYVWCGSPLTCMTSASYLACCTNKSECQPRATSCVDRDGDCDFACGNDPRILKCNPTVPKCQTLVYGEDIPFYGCGTTHVSASFSVFDNIPTAIVMPTTTTSTSTSTEEDDSTTSTSTSSRITSLEDMDATTTNAGDVGLGVGSGDSTATSTPPAETGESGGSSLSGGAIAGIVIGSLAFVAAAGAGLLALYFMMKKKSQQQGPPQIDNMSQQQPPVQPAAGGGYYDPSKPASPPAYIDTHGSPHMPTELATYQPVTMPYEMPGSQVPDQPSHRY
ncbi:hypothetical protein AJ80_07876 [Polytolypa hystricis UAMH7299]|uniref:Mid2 domain-containing protein n=1 Tax=Polytolypa hystricis (strain UAMH7299) TaxID=1447883 RepID=A0A2B7XH89_POLH7|nr:hypothetical protein AJ80_07876 [Polytolypa hystricis UAMH7299]